MFFSEAGVGEFHCEVERSDQKKVVLGHWKKMFSVAKKDEEKPATKWLREFGSKKKKKKKKIRVV